MLNEAPGRMMMQLSDMRYGMQPPIWYAALIWYAAAECNMQLSRPAIQFQMVTILGG
jgi:hypothetical protein